MDEGIGSDRWRYLLKTQGLSDCEIDELVEKSLDSMFVDAWDSRQAEKVRLAEVDEELLRKVVAGEIAKATGILAAAIPEGESGYSDKSMEARDRFIYGLKQKGFKNKEIIAELEKKSCREGWEPLTTSRAIVHSVDRYTKLAKAPALLPAKGGRPKGNTAK